MGDRAPMTMIVRRATAQHHCHRRYIASGHCTCFVMSLWGIGHRMRFVVGWLSRTKRWTRPRWCITLLACFGLCILVDSVRMWISLKVMPTHRALYAPRRVLANHGKLGSGTGLNNQRSALFRMCLLAQELDAHIAVQTLHWVGNHSAEFQAVPLKMHKEVWDVGVWNQRAGSVLPLMVDSAPTHWYM